MKKDWANLNRYSVENKKLPEPKKNECRVVFMGDSITEFWKSISSNFFSNQSYINRGISGQTTPQMLIRFRPDVIALNPSLVVILAGINDIAQNTGPMELKDTFGNIVSMAELAKANKIRVILSSVLPACDFKWRSGLEPAEKVFMLNKMIKQYCRKNRIVYVDYYSKMVDERKGLNKQFTDDGVHPLSTGYEVMETLVKKAIKQAFIQ